MIRGFAHSRFHDGRSAPSQVEPPMPSSLDTTAGRQLAPGERRQDPSEGGAAWPTQGRWPAWAPVIPILLLAATVRLWGLGAQPVLYFDSGVYLGEGAFLASATHRAAAALISSAPGNPLEQIALAAQSILANFLASLILQVRRPFKRGDQVETNDCEGIVEDRGDQVVTAICDRRPVVVAKIGW